METLSPKQIQRKLNALQLHQIELESQNQELRREHAELEIARKRYFDLYNLSPVGYCTISGQELILEANITAAKLLCNSQKMLVGQQLTRFILPEDHEIYYLHCKQLKETSKPQVLELRMVKENGLPFWVRIETSVAQDVEGTPVQCVVLSNINKFKRVEEIQTFLAKTSSGSAAVPFFNSLAQYLAQSLGMDFVCIDRLEADGLTAQTVVVWSDGHFRDNVIYALKDTPCGEVVGNAVCCFPANVCQVFPRNQVLKDMQAESYIGVTLWAHSGQPIGLIAVIGRNPLTNRLLAETTLKLVAIRASGEIERLMAEEALRKAQAILKAAIDNNPVGIVIADAPSGVLRYVNDAGLLIRGGDREKIVNGIGIDQYVSNWQFMNVDGHPMKPEEVPLTRAIKFGETCSGEFVIRRAPDDDRIVVAKASPIMDDNGMIAAGVVSFMDITARKMMEVLLQKANDELEQQVEERTAKLVVAMKEAEKEKQKALIALTEIKFLKNQLEAERAYLMEEIKLESNHERIIGHSDGLKSVLHKVEQIAGGDTTVLVLGETGTGKELIARAIHGLSARKNRTLVKVNCAALPSNLIESELFGHEKGAFTGAQSRHLGRFEVADGATLFLDEIGELPLELQPKLLRVLQDGEFERLGGTRTIKVDARIIAATNRNLEEEVRNGRFREDLWYRLNVYPITIPALRERTGDIALLVNYIVPKICKRMGKNIRLIPTSVMNALQDYHWPGNIRELENVLERAVINSSGLKLHLADELKKPVKGLIMSRKTLEEVERDYIIQTLEQTHWKVGGINSAAQILGLDRSTLRSRMSKLNIKKP